MLYENTRLVAGEAARSDGLGVMTPAVDSPGSPEVNEVDQKFVAFPASEALRVPYSRRVVYRSVCTDC